MGKYGIILKQNKTKKIIEARNQQVKILKAWGKILSKNKTQFIHKTSLILKLCFKNEGEIKVNQDKKNEKICCCQTCPS